MTAPTALPTASIKPKWREYSGRGDMLHTCPSADVAFFMRADDRETVWVFGPPLPETMDEARGRVAAHE